jgi:hypothetical protein
MRALPANGLFHSLIMFPSARPDDSPNYSLLLLWVIKGEENFRRLPVTGDDTYVTWRDFRPCHQYFHLS